MRRLLANAIRRFRAAERCATAIEYGLIAAYHLGDYRRRHVARHESECVVDQRLNRVPLKPLLAGLFVCRYFP
jgi:uncharacterized protein (UPF0303 family)